MSGINDPLSKGPILWNMIEGYQWLIILTIGLTGLFLMLNLTDLVQSFQEQKADDKNKNKVIGMSVVSALTIVAGAILYGYHVNGRSLTNHNQLLAFSSVSIGLFGSVYLLINNWYDIKSIMNTSVATVSFAGACAVGYYLSPDVTIKDLIKCK